jgi:hypothetical protein
LLVTLALVLLPGPATALAAPAGRLAAPEAAASVETRCPRPKPSAAPKCPERPIEIRATGADSTEGTTGDDAVIRSVGNDRLPGGSGNDDLDGNEGIDGIEGAGKDQIRVPDAEPPWARPPDNLTLDLVGGREQTEREFRALLAGSRFTLAKVAPTATGTGVLEARPARPNRETLRPDETGPARAGTR